MEQTVGQSDGACSVSACAVSAYAYYALSHLHAWWDRRDSENHRMHVPHGLSVDTTILNYTIFYFWS